jgi:hypothetical protein
MKVVFDTGKSTRRFFFRIVEFASKPLCWHLDDLVGIFTCFICKMNHPGCFADREPNVCKKHSRPVFLREQFHEKVRLETPGGSRIAFAFLRNLSSLKFYGKGDFDMARERGEGVNMIKDVLYMSEDVTMMYFLHYYMLIKSCAP